MTGFFTFTGPPLLMMGWSLHRFLIFTVLLLAPLTAISSADDPDSFIQEWQIDEIWKGSYDGMFELRKIWVLVAHNNRLFFLDKAMIR